MIKYAEIPRVGKLILISLFFIGIAGAVYSIISATWSLRLVVIGLIAILTESFRLTLLYGFIGFGGPLIIGCLVSGLFSFAELLTIVIFQQIPRLFDKPRTPMLKLIGNLSESITTLSITWAIWNIIHGPSYSLFSLHGLVTSIITLITYVLLNHLIISMLIIYVYPRPNKSLSESFTQILRTSLTTVITQYLYAILFAGIFVELGSSVFLFGISLFFIIGFLGLLSVKTRVQKSSLDAQLRSNEEFLHDLVENMDNGLIAYDSQGKIIHINTAAKALAGEAVEPGTSIQETPFRPLLDQVKEHVTSECTLNGRLVRVRKAAVSETDSGNSGVVLILEDITEAKVIEDYAMHKDRLTLLGEFSAGIMHEISKPLMMLSLAYEQISSTGTSSKNLSILGRGIDELTDLSHQLLNFSSPRPGRGRSFSNITAILSETLDIAGALAKKKQINLVLADNYDLMADIDEHEVRQVLFNLISNAIDVTPASGTIRFSTGLGDYHLDADPIWEKDFRDGRDSQGWFTVEDQGAGFSAEVITRLGDSFVTTKDEGHGLGLSIVLLLIKRWNAKIGIYRSSSGGSRVVVEV